VQRQRERQSGKRRREKLETTLDAEHCRLRQRETERVEGEGQPRDVEIAVRQHRVGVHDDKGALGRAVQFEFDVVTGAKERRQRSAVHLRHTTQRQRILHAARGTRLPQAAAREERRQACGNRSLARRGMRGLHTRFQRTQVRAKPFEGQRRRNVQCIQGARAVARDQRCVADGRGVRADQRDAVLGTKPHGL
jgi:hypothetical protein